VSDLNRWAKNMTKNEASWLAIRSAGVLSAYVAIKSIAAPFYMLWLLTAIPYKEIRDSLPNRMSWDIASRSAFEFITYSILAVYLMRKGRLIHRILNKE
jgi:hypothetical protein